MSIATTRARAADRGFTLPEILIAMTVSGILASALALAFSVVVRSQTGATQRIGESKDITFVQTWLPADLSSATKTWVDPQLGFLDASLPGTNVVTMARPDIDTGGAYLIMYRYEEIAGRGWVLVRYRVDNPGCPTATPVVGNCAGGPETVKRVGVAYELVSPPADWTTDQAPIHAVEVNRRNGGSAYGAGTEDRPVGEDVTVHFKSGSIYVAGGSGLSAGQEIDPNPQVIPDPVAPPSRCGRRVLVVLDVSSSISSNTTKQRVREAADSFVTGFLGTPGEINIVSFDRWLEPIGGPPGTFFDTLNDSSGRLAELQSNRSDVTTIANFPFQPHTSGTNWELGIMSSYAMPANWETGPNSQNASSPDRSNLEYHDYVPDLVVFVTDGNPSVNLNSSANWYWNSSPNSAVAAANTARELGVTDIIGVMVNNTSNESSINRLGSVVGGVRWDGNLPGNAAEADYYAGNFDQLGTIVRSITARECGGALTIQKSFSDGTPASSTGVWEFQSEQGSKVLDYGSSSSVTFQHDFQTTETFKEFWIEEQPRAGWVVDDISCTSEGLPLTTAPVKTTTPGQPDRFTIRLEPDQAVSCFIESDPD